MAAEDTDRIIRFRSMGTEYTINEDRITPKIFRECRAETGCHPELLLAMISEAMEQPDHVGTLGLARSMGLDMVAALIWLARRTAGEPAQLQKGRRTVSLYDDLSDGLRVGRPETFELIVDEEVAPDPGT